MRTTVDAAGQTSFHFSRKEIDILLSMMSDDASRGSLYGLALDAERGRALATDGHRMIQVETSDRLENDRAVKSGVSLISRTTIEAMRASAGPKDEITVIATGDDGNFPKWDRVAPVLGSDHIGVAQGFCGAYLADLAAIVTACPPTVRKNYKKIPGLVFYPGASALDPAVAIVESPANSCRWTALLMPQRI